MFNKKFSVECFFLLIKWKEDAQWSGIRCIKYVGICQTIRKYVNI